MYLHTHIIHTCIYIGWMPALCQERGHSFSRELGGLSRSPRYSTRARDVWRGISGRGISRLRRTVTVLCPLVPRVVFFPWRGTRHHARAHTNTHTHTHTHTHAQSHTHTHAHTHTRTCTRTHVHTHTYAHTYTHIHIYTHAHIHARTNKHSLTRTHTLTLMHTRTHAHAHTHTHSHSLSHAHLRCSDGPNDSVLWTPYAHGAGVAACCSVLQRVAVRCFVNTICTWSRCRIMLQCVAASCSVLQQVATGMFNTICTRNRCIMK